MLAVYVSTAFIDDRSGRDLPCGQVNELPGKKGQSRVVADDATLADLIDDAAYQGWHTDADLSVRLPAQAAFRQLVSAGLTYSKGIRYQRGRVVPGDAPVR